MPQGSVLGPKAYTMYTKPVGSLIKQHGPGYHFYADASQLYVAFKLRNTVAQTTALKMAETCLSDIQAWMHYNMLKLNTDKTEVMLFTSKHNKKYIENVVVKVGDCPTPSTSCVRNLGVLWDSMLNMQQQVNSVSYAQLRNIGHIRRYLTTEATKSLVHGLVTSRLDYCNSLLCGVPQVMLSKLQRVQNTAARIVTRTSRHSHITPVLRELHWLPIQSLVEYKVLMYTYKALHDLAPGHMRDMLTVYEPRRTLRSMNSLTLVVPRPRSACYGDRQFGFMGAKMWNALPSHIRDAKTLNQFKTLLKTLMFVTNFGA